MRESGKGTRPGCRSSAPGAAPWGAASNAGERGPERPPRGGGRFAPTPWPDATGSPPAGHVPCTSTARSITQPPGNRGATDGGRLETCSTTGTGGSCALGAGTLQSLCGSSTAGGSASKGRGHDRDGSLRGNARGAAVELGSHGGRPSKSRCGAAPLRRISSEATATTRTTTPTTAPIQSADEPGISTAAAAGTSDDMVGSVTAGTNVPETLGSQSVDLSRG